MNIANAKISKEEIDKQVRHIASLIAMYNPTLAQDFIDKPYHREINITAFIGGFTNKTNAITTEIVCRYIDLTNQINYGV